MCLGIPGKIIEICDKSKLIATVDVSGVRRSINIACIVDEKHPIESCLGEWVLIHVGFAMARIDEQEASETLALLEALGEAQEEMRAMTNSNQNQTAVGDNL